MGRRVIAAVAVLALLAVASPAAAQKQAGGGQGAGQPAAAGSAASGAAPVGGAAPAAGAPPKVQKAFNKLSLFSALVSGAGTGIKAKLDGALAEFLSVVLDNQSGFNQPEGVFDLGASGAAAVAWPAGNLRALSDYAAALKTSAGADTVAGLAAATTTMLDGLCTPETFAPQQFVGAGCSSPEVELRLVPAECLADAVTGAMTCRPAYLLLETRPAVCHGPYYTAAQWFGRSCAPYSLIGPKVDYALGYAEYNIAAPNLANLTAAIKAPLAAAGSELLAKLGALEAKKAGLMGGAAPVGGGTAATTAAVDGAGNGGREDKKAEKAAAKEDKKAAKEEEGRGSGAPSAAGGASSGR